MDKMHNCPSGYFVAHEQLASSGKSPAHFRPSRLGKRGVSRSSRHAGWEAMDEAARSGALTSRTNALLRTAKSCGPGLPALRSSLRCDELAGDGGKNAGPRG